MHPYETELTLAKEIAQKAGVIMRQYFRTENGREEKADGSPVTLADKAINRMVIKEIQKHFSDIVIGEEESTGEYGMGRRWICDPIDGTKAYVWGVPTAMFSLGFVVDGVPMLGVAYDPFLNHLYEAVRGGGSFCDGKSIHVSTSPLSGGYVALTSSPRKIIALTSSVTYLHEHGAKTATFSGAVYKMCLVAQGSLVGYFEAGVNAHDTAAGHVIVEEAGGRASAYDGTPLLYSHPFKAAVFSNGIVHSELLASIHIKSN